MFALFGDTPQARNKASGISPVLIIEKKNMQYYTEICISVSPQCSLILSWSREGVTEGSKVGRREDIEGATVLGKSRGRCHQCLTC